MPAPAAPARGLSRPDLLVGLGVVALAGLSGYSTLRVPQAAIYATVGPTVFPWIVTFLLAVLGLALVLQALRGGWTDPADQDVIEWPKLGYLVAGLAVNLLAIGQLGFILASTAMFVLAARAFDSRTPLKDAGIGFTLALTAFVFFDRILNYRIGSGLVEDRVVPFIEGVRAWIL